MTPTAVHHHSAYPEPDAGTGRDLAEPRPLSVLALSLRTFNSLSRARIHTVEAAAAASDHALLQLPNFGTGSLAQLRFAIGRETADRSPTESCDRAIDPSLESLRLSTRTHNCLIRAGIDTRRKLDATSDDELLQLPNFGAGCLSEVKRIRRNGTGAVDGPPPAPSVRPLTPLSSLPLSVRSYNALTRVGIRTVEALDARSSEQLLCIPNFGKGCLDEIEALRTQAPRSNLRPPPVALTNVEARAPTTPINPRVKLLNDMCEQGATLAEMGERLGVTRERARQLLKAYGLGEDRIVNRRERTLSAARVHANELLAGYRAGQDIATVGERFGISKAAADAVLDEVITQADRLARRAAKSAKSAAGDRKYSDADLLDAIRWAASELERTPSAGEYSGLAGSHSLPSLPTVSNRFGSWSAAVLAAGMTPAGSGRGSYKRRWTDEACRAALARLFAQLGEPPTVQQYDLLAGLDDELPSIATVRNRLGRWTAVCGHVMQLIDASASASRNLDLESAPDNQTRHEKIWLAHLADEITDEQLQALRLTGLFEWNDDGEPVGNHETSTD